jgi:hypothetical protein
MLLANSVEKIRSFHDAEQIRIVALPRVRLPRTCRAPAASGELKPGRRAISAGRCSKSGMKQIYLGYDGTTIRFK